MTEQSVEIKNLQEVLQPFLKNSKILKVTTKPLTTAGENYGSLMLLADIKLQHNSKEKILNFVVKMCPPNEWLKKMFNVQVTFPKEIAMYTTIIPTIQEFQRQQGMLNILDSFPEYFGARINLNNSTTVDDDAIILLENLKNFGFEVVDRMRGFDLETARLILKDLAVLHATPIAIKLNNPELFKEALLPHLGKAQVFSSGMETVGVTMMNGIVETIKLNEECIPLIPRVLEALRQTVENLKNGLSYREPLASLCHNDLWINNTMIKFENGKPVKNKFIDFQLIDYGSPLNDVIFFLFTSLQNEVFDLHYDDLLRFYYESFIDTLKKLKCDFTINYEAFLEELDLVAKNNQFFHIVIMLRPIYAIKEKVTELSKMSEEDILKQDVTSEKYQQRLVEIVLEFAKRNWI